MADPGDTPRELSFSRPSADVLETRLAGRWLLRDGLASPDELRARLETDRPARLTFDTTALGRWDSALVTFLAGAIEDAERAGARVERDGLPPGARRLLELAAAVPEAARAEPETTRAGWLARLGAGTLAAVRALPEALAFFGEVTLSFFRWLRGRARFRLGDFFWTVQEVGARALPITSLLSFLIGLTLAYVGAAQLRQFGAQIYVADLVGLAVVREMGALMTGIILAGRTGAAFAAQLGTMQVNEEIDALKTLAISPLDFLVLPRMLALVAMAPLLCLYADLLGLVGGAVIGVATMDLGVVEYYEQSKGAIGFGDFLVGVVKATVFGVVVAVAGCFHGIRSGRSSAAVGIATTAAVVASIVWIIVTDATLTVIFDTLGV